MSKHWSQTECSKIKPVLPGVKFLVLAEPKQVGVDQLLDKIFSCKSVIFTFYLPIRRLCWCDRFSHELTIWGPFLQKNFLFMSTAHEIPLLFWRGLFKRIITVMRHYKNYKSRLTRVSSVWHFGWTWKRQYWQQGFFILKCCYYCVYKQ